MDRRFNLKRWFEAAYIEAGSADPCPVSMPNDGKAHLFSSPSGGPTFRLPSGSNE